MILAIVGSVELATYQVVEAGEIIRAEIRDSRPRGIISGRADGIDRLAVYIARSEFELPVIECLPARQSWEFFKSRNQLIADLCDELVRIASSISKTYGSGWTADRAEEQGKPVRRYTV